MALARVIPVLKPSTICPIQEADPELIPSIMGTSFSIFTFESAFIINSITY